MPARKIIPNKRSSIVRKPQASAPKRIAPSQAREPGTRARRVRQSGRRQPVPARGQLVGRPATAQSAAPKANGEERRRWQKAVRSQERVRADQQEAEARDMQEKAKEMMKAAKERRRRELAHKRHNDYVSSMAPELGLNPNRPTTEIPPLGPGLKEVDRRVVKEGFAYVRVAYDTNSNEHVYQVLEPQLDDLEQEVMEFIRDTLIRTLDARVGQDGTDEDVLNEAIDTVIADHAVLIDDVSTRRIRYHLVRDFLGFGPIDVMMHDPDLEDISCDGPNIPIYLFHRHLESMRTNVQWEDENALDSYVIRLAQRSGKHISIADPVLDATLPDGSRLQATLSREVTTRGSSFTIRKFKENPMTPPNLLEYGTMDARMAAWFWIVMEHGMSLILAGGTASGKTTTLNAISQFIPPEKKVVSIEDTREINLQHENWIAGVTRAGFGGTDAFGRRAGAIDMFHLLEAALRQRPEYLLVGEVRGKEAVTLFQAMATGHAVYSTMHADSAESAVYRLENPPIGVPRLMLQTLDVIVIQGQVRVGDKMVRRIEHITELVGFDPDTRDLLTNDVFAWDVKDDSHNYTGKSFLLDRIMAMKNLTEVEIQKDWDDRVDVLRWLQQKGAAELATFSESVGQFYHNRDALMEIVHAELEPEPEPGPEPESESEPESEPVSEPGPKRETEGEAAEGVEAVSAGGTHAADVGDMAADSEAEAPPSTEEE